MKPSLAVLVAILAVAMAAPAAAQQNERQGDENLSGQERLLRALLLPRTTREARQAGVEEEELRKVLRTGRERDVPPGEMDVILQEEVRAVKEHGPIDNFGAFVQARLDQGLRGRELAAAIRAEHAARGKGKGAGAGKAEGRDAKGKMLKTKAAGKQGAAEEAGDARSGKGKAKRKSGAEKEDDR